jgi:glycosyltransferase involved in cell wall biosynthesis
MTPGVSLHTWKKQGILNREIRPYLSLVETGWRVKILTFRKERAKHYGLPAEIQTVFFPHHRLLGWLPYIYASLSAQTDILQTNQSYGAWHYTGAAQQWKKPILLRCGFVYGQGLEVEKGNTKDVRGYQRLEARAFAQATMVETTTRDLANWIVERYHIAPGKVEVIPNYIDASRFCPDHKITKEPASVVSIGNLHPVKRFELLIEACSMVEVSRLTIIGDGPEESRLRNLAMRLHVNLTLPGRVPNEALPGLLRRAQIYAVTSLREGHPKALFEAMACSLGCVGVNVTGIRESLLESGGGLLVEASPVAIARGLADLKSDRELCESAGRRGREFVESTMSYPLVLSRKMSLLERCLAT